jgi:hypothetical protein
MYTLLAPEQLGVFYTYLYLVLSSYRSVSSLAPKIGALPMGLKNKMVISSKMAPILIKFWQFMEVILNKSAQAIPSGKQGPKCLCNTYAPKLWPTMVCQTTITFVSKVMLSRSTEPEKPALRAGFHCCLVFWDQ